MIVRRGVNLDLLIEPYTDATKTTRLTLNDGALFTVTFCGNTYRSTDVSPAVTVVAASNPTGKALAFSLDAAATAALTGSRSSFEVLRTDPVDPGNVSLLAKTTLVVQSL